MLASSAICDVISFFVTKKSLKIRKIDKNSWYWRRKSSYLLNTCRISMKFSRKMWLWCDITLHKSFLLKFSDVFNIKLRFSHICWKNPSWFYDVIVGLKFVRPYIKCFHGFTKFNALTRINVYDCGTTGVHYLGKRKTSQLTYGCSKRGDPCSKSTRKVPEQCVVGNQFRVYNKDTRTTSTERTKWQQISREIKEKKKQK